MSIYDDSAEAHARHRRKMRDVQKWTLEHTPYEVGDPFSPATQVGAGWLDARDSLMPNTHGGTVVADPNRVSYWPPTISEAGAEVSTSRTGGGGKQRPAPQRVHTAPQMAGGSRVPPMSVPPMPIPPVPMGIPPPPLLRVQTAPHSLPVYPVAGMEAYGPAVRGPARSGYPPMAGQPPTTGYPPMTGQPPTTGYPPMVSHAPMVSHPPMVSQPPIPRTRKPSKSTRPGTPIPGGPTITVTAPTPPAKLRKKTSLAALFKSSRTKTPQLVYSNAKLVRSTPHLGQASTVNLVSASTATLGGASMAELGGASSADLLNASTAKLVDDPRSWYKTNASTTQLDPSRSWYKRAPADPQAIYPRDADDFLKDSRKAKLVTDKQPKSPEDKPPRSPTDTKKPVKKLVKDIFNIGGKPRERAQTLQSPASSLQPQLVVLPPLVSAFQQDPVPTFQRDHEPIPSRIKVFQSPENVTTVAIDAEGSSHSRRHRSRSRSRERRHRERSHERHRERKDEHHSHRSPTRERHREDRDDRGHHKSSRRRDAFRHHGSSRDDHGSSDHHGFRDGHRSHKHVRERSRNRHDREDKPREREHRSRHHSRDRDH
ncbi:hypothetical protein K525DRAFT_290237 [Schizophyllum commune Loenen D]|nr:hypothetical protein K525DRAFT_290237 [Schizophyllum commune Loenen D]